jgi:hypothetical protein
LKTEQDLKDPKMVERNPSRREICATSHTSYSHDENEYRVPITP